MKNNLNVFAFKNHEKNIENTFQTSLQTVRGHTELRETQKYQEWRGGGGVRARLF